MNCPMIDRYCPFLGISNDIPHCGIAKGSEFETRISNIKKCPKKDKK